MVSTDKGTHTMLAFPAPMVLPYNLVNLAKD